MSEHMFAHKILGSGTEKFSVHYIQVRACGPDFESPQAKKTTQSCYGKDTEFIYPEDIYSFHDGEPRHE